MACVPSQQSYNFHISAQEVTGSVLAGPDGKGWRFHCCEIKGKPHIVYPVGMAESDPKAFAQLQIFSLDHDIQLIEERRKHKKLVASNLRRPWLPVLLLSISANTALAEHNTPDEHWQQELQLASEENVEQAIEDSPLPQSFSKTFQPDAQNTRQLLQILEQHYQPEEADPFNMGEELQLMASYYSQFPSVVELLHSLANLNWQLKFEKRSFRTEVRGTKLSVENATIYFDPHFAARLKFQSSCRDKTPFCVASPADALLHELLHLETILLHTQEYIANGGMGGLLYPFAHERKTIARENDLYRAMTAIDGQPRPIRNEHTGRYVMVACSTCIE